MRKSRFMDVLVEKCRYSPHFLRATAITLLAERGEALIDLRNFAGHAQTRTTKTYIKRFKGQTRCDFAEIAILITKFLSFFQQINMATG